MVYPLEKLSNLKSLFPETLQLFRHQRYALERVQTLADVPEVGGSSEENFSPPRAVALLFYLKFLVEPYRLFSFCHVYLGLSSPFTIVWAEIKNFSSFT